MTSGDICLVVSDLPCCQSNIGAWVTLVEHSAAGWSFKDASRELVSDNGDVRTHIDDNDLLLMPDELLWVVRAAGL